MLTCSVAGALPGPLRRGGQRLLPPLLHPSSESNLLSLKQCVHKLMTRQQQRFLSPLSSPSSSIPLTQSSQSLLQQDATPTWGWRGCRRGTRHYYCCCLLNLNHHINFHYINNSSILNTYHHHQHRSLHQSTSAAMAGAAVTNNGSITPNNSLCQDIVNDSRERGGGLLGKGKEQHNDVDEEGEKEEEENLKEHIWGLGPALLPTFNVGAYANESENVKKLVQLGVDLSEWEGRYGSIPLLYKSNFEKTMQPIIRFLKDVGVDGPDLSRILTVNPFIFEEDVRNLGKRLEYLKVKRFSEDAIFNIITRNPYWLTFSVPRIDRRLGFFQTYFGLTGDQVRRLASAGTSGPKLITYNLGHVKDVTFAIKEEMGFTSEEIVTLLLERPRIWKGEDTHAIKGRFNYLHNEEKFPHEVFLQHPYLLLIRERRLRDRIGFLKELGRAQFNPEQPNYISLEEICYRSDSDFATQWAGTSVEEYNNYLKTL